MYESKCGPWCDRLEHRANQLDGLGYGAPLHGPAGSGQYWQEDEMSNHWCKLDVDPSGGTVTLGARRLTRGGVIETYQLNPTP